MSFLYTDRSPFLNSAIMFAYIHLSASLPINIVDASSDLIAHSLQGQAKAFENLKCCIMCYENL